MRMSQQESLKNVRYIFKNLRPKKPSMPSSLIRKQIKQLQHMKSYIDSNSLLRKQSHNTTSKKPYYFKKRATPKIQKPKMGKSNKHFISLNILLHPDSAKKEPILQEALKKRNSTSALKPRKSRPQNHPDNSQDSFKSMRIKPRVARIKKPKSKSFCKKSQSA